MVRIDEASDRPLVRSKTRGKNVRFADHVEARWSNDEIHLSVQAHETRLFNPHVIGLPANSRDLVPAAPRFNEKGRSFRTSTPTKTVAAATAYPVRAYDRGMFGWDASELHDDHARFTRYPRPSEPIDFLALILHILHPDRLM